jgi:SpoVK/Ycf46/Vps4 family AAA+-type ATPase
MLAKFHTVLSLVPLFIFSMSLTYTPDTKVPGKTNGTPANTANHENGKYQDASTKTNEIKNLPGNVGQESQKPDSQKNTSPLPAKFAPWVLESSLKNAPQLVKGILNYLKKRHIYGVVPSFHRLILVGEPGTGKTTLAFALADALKYEIRFVPAMSFLGRYRNQTAVNMREFFSSFFNEESRNPKIIIIDELHKLFEHHGHENCDDSENAATFWLMLDMLEIKCPHIIVIGTANSVTKLPPEIKSRFHGKIITIPLPHKNQKLQAFKEILNNDMQIQLDESVNEYFIASFINKIRDWSLRDIQLLVDAAKMFKYAQGPQEYPLILKREHFEQAYAQLEAENEHGKKSLYERTLPQLKEISFCLSLCLSAVHLSVLLSHR